VDPWNAVNVFVTFGITGVVAKAIWEVCCPSTVMVVRTAGVAATTTLMKVAKSWHDEHLL